MDWSPYDKDLRHERVNINIKTITELTRGNRKTLKQIYDLMRKDALKTPQSTARIKRDKVAAKTRHAEKIICDIEIHSI